MRSSGLDAEIPDTTLKQGWRGWKSSSTSREAVADLDPVALYQEHEKHFGSISDWLAEYYTGYSNRDKIIALLSYWLYAYRCIVACYGIEGAREFCRSGFGSHIRFAFFHEYGIDLGRKLPAISNRLWFHIAAGMMSTAYLPGGRVRSIYSKLAWRLTRLAATRAPVTVHKSRKDALIEKLAGCFEGMDAGVSEEWFADALPAVFSADQIDVLRRKSLRVDCSTVSFMDFVGYENLLLFDRRLDVTGRQHGGGYDMFAVDYFLLFEKTLSDRFIGWGMSGENERQHKYRITDRRANMPGGKKRLIWVERSLCPRIWFLLNPIFYAQQNDRAVIEYVYRELTAVQRGFLNLEYPGRMGSPDYAGMRGELLTSVTARGEDAIRTDDIVLFDISGGSLIHHCIDNEIAFVVVNRREDMPYFTEPKREWLNILRRSGLAFYDDEVGLLSRRLSDMLADDYELPADVRKYHRERFIDIR